LREIAFRLYKLDINEKDKVDLRYIMYWIFYLWIIKNKINSWCWEIL